MAKLCMTEREIKRTKMVEKFKTKRLELNTIIRDSSATKEQQAEARLKLQNLPRNSSPVRLRTRCALTGRPRGVYRKFGLSRIAFRELASDGKLPGVVKSSW